MAGTADGLVITGPTASGKTALAITVAERLGGEIISLDSRQVYQGMDIGTAKPTVEQRARVPHFGIDVLSPGRRYTAGRFAADARAWIAAIRARHHVPVLVGGTGFFLRALTQPMFAEPPLDPARKESLKRYLEDFSREELLRWLSGLDAAAAQRLAREGGRQRLARAVEVALLTGRTLTEWHAQQPPGQPLDLTTFVLELPRAELYDRINRRVDEMLAAGLVEEVRGLRAAGYDEQAPGVNATGYIELIPYLRGETTLDDAADRIRANTRSYARRQLTWFRHQLGPNAIRLDATRPINELADEIVQRYRSAKSA
ncbi:MAG: tRNA (adenosine(37)-N6)-dimethylallyltransferase MiaA [Gemmatimonadota bacterium]